MSGNLYLNWHITYFNVFALFLNTPKQTFIEKWRARTHHILIYQTMNIVKRVGGWNLEITKIHCKIQ